ncbi:MAG: hypothetical protein ACE15C_03935 [Phycisphaerae bacterium]
MHDSHWEAVGFLCRWCLLALACTAIAAVLWVSAAGAVAGRGDQTKLTFPDRIKPPEGVPICGLLRPSNGGGSQGDFIVAPPGGEAKAAITGDSEVWILVDQARAGGNRFIVKGSPYGPTAMISQEAKVIGIGEGAELFAIDARIPLRGSGPQREGLSRRIDALRGLGTVVFFDGDDVTQYARDRAALAAMGLDIPIIGRPCDKSDWPAVLCEIAGSVRQAKGRVKIITADGELARAAAAEGLAVEGFNLGLP